VNYGQPARSSTAPEGAKLSRKFECDVFNFLLENRDALGVQTVFKFKNLFVDGAVQLTKTVVEKLLQGLAERKDYLLGVPNPTWADLERNTFPT
jgi:hypothetical protein